jgi:ATP-dependent Clp protease protease subunit
MSYILPYIVEKNGDSERHKDVFTRLFEDRIIFLSGTVDDVLSNMIVAQLLYLSADSDRDIYLYINSPGGSIAAGLAIFDTMKYISCDITTICVGSACSMGAFLLAAGTKGKRKALPNSRILIHQPLGGAEGQATEIEIAYKQITRYKELLTRYLSEFTGQPYEKVMVDCDRDHYMTAIEAKEYGLIDSVVVHQLLDKGEE